MLKLYDYPASQNGWKARALLALLKQPYETIWVPIFGTPDPEFLKLNPLGKVPVLELEDGRAIPESHAVDAAIVAPQELRHGAVHEGLTAALDHVDEVAHAQTHPVDAPLVEADAPRGRDEPRLEALHLLRGEP